jgi:hypothetical protein
MVRAGGRIHIGSPPRRPNSVLKVSSILPCSAGALGRGRVGFANVQDDVARAVLSGWPGSRDGDQACDAASFAGRRSPAGSAQDRAGVCTKRIGEIRSAGVARIARGGGDCGAGCADDASSNCIDQSRDDQQGRRTALGRRQCYDQPRRAGSSHSQSEAIEEDCQQISFYGKIIFHGKTRGLALPTGHHGEPVTVVGSLSAMQFVDRTAFFWFCCSFSSV